MCECCFESRKVRWTCVDNNWEAELCQPCREALRRLGEKVEVLS